MLPQRVKAGSYISTAQAKDSRTSFINNTLKKILGNCVPKWIVELELAIVDELRKRKWLQW